MSKDLTKAIDDRNNILLTGGAGVGKTYHTNKIIEHLQKKGRKFAVCAMTGLASQHLHFGMTIHRFLGVGNKTRASDIADLIGNSNFIETLDSLKDLSAIITDEVSMMRADFLELMNLVLQHARVRTNVIKGIKNDPQENLPFGGYQIIFVGDFLQLPPVVPEDDEVPCKWIFQHELFKQAKFRVYCLTETKRTSDPKFADALNKLRVGHCDQETYDMLWARTDAKLDGEATVLMSRVKSVEAYNTRRLKDHPGPIHTLSGVMKIREELQSNTDVVRKLYAQILKECPLEKNIDVKIGCRVMLLSNNSYMDYSNGSQGTLTDIRDITKSNTTWTDNKGHVYELDYSYFGECLHITLDNGRDVLVPRKPYHIYGNTFNDEGKRMADISFYQHPVILGYAVSIHKSQGMSLDRMILDCSKIFADGQLYVGVSRARSLQGMCILNFHQGYVRADQEAVEFYIKIMSMKPGEIYV